MREDIKWTPKVNTKLETCGLSPLIRNKVIFRLSPLKRKYYYVIKFVSDLRQVGGFLRVFRIPPPIKLTTMI
jgi:hypothetical protein